MKVVYSKILPPKGFVAINLFGVCVVRKEYEQDFRDNTPYSKKVLHHESIHTAQMKEMAYIGFYIAYFFEWLYRLFINGQKAYYHISFEREAFKYEKRLDYLRIRKPFAQYRKETF